MTHSLRAERNQTKLSEISEDLSGSNPTRIVNLIVNYLSTLYFAPTL